ncbi:hypothetical protein [Roseisalinus antarcticus]|uniref:Uncharacterized protein n=1 Tax=Roseisalinus antarcticus TaxID=254357 RepID=A0A1Y5T2D8_9RHOB|nr:hypothetical protein [Roseisalinus antarcticus]SLN50560.1 hypothetical protein ROA7023_02191 [Roseisalinus antarcticus]
MTGTPLQPTQALRNPADIASAYLEQARPVAEAKFGVDAVRDIPLLVVQVAALMAQLNTTQSSEAP